MKIIGIIPARYASTRFPGKPLEDINGKTMIQRVYEQAKKSASLSQVTVATDDLRIEACVKKFGGDVVMTAGYHKSGTDRCMEASTKLGNQEFDIVINIQGDEPFINPEQIDEVAKLFEDGNTQIATLVKKINDADELQNHNIPKVTLTMEGFAVYFSRTPIPYYKGVKIQEWLNKHIYYKHVGIYAYRKVALEKITKLEPSSLELAESLEQLRWIENGYKIRVAITSYESFSIDTPGDLIKSIKGYPGLK